MNFIIIIQAFKFFKQKPSNRIRGYNSLFFFRRGRERGVGKREGGGGEEREEGGGEERKEGEGKERGKIQGKRKKRDIMEQRFQKRNVRGNKTETFQFKNSH